MLQRLVRALVMKSVVGSLTAIRLLSKVPNRSREAYLIISVVRFCAGMPELAVPPASATLCCAPSVSAPRRVGCLWRWSAPRWPSRSGRRSQALRGGHRSLLLGAKSSNQKQKTIKDLESMRNSTTKMSRRPPWARRWRREQFGDPLEGDDGPQPVPPDRDEHARG